MIFTIRSSSSLAQALVSDEHCHCSLLQPGPEALSDVNRTGLDETLALLPASSEARGYSVDVSSREAVYTHAEDVRRDFGTAHVLINNAGAALIGTIAHTSIEEFEWQIGINLWG